MKQAEKERKACKDCKYFRVAYEPIKPSRITDKGLAYCRMTGQRFEFADRAELEKLMCAKERGQE